MNTQEEYAHFIPLLLPVAGFAWQWVRQHSRVPDQWTAVLAVVVACGVYALCFDYTHVPPTQKLIIDLLLWLPMAVTSVLGGTFTASSAAKAGVAAIPMTNSK